MRTLAEDRFLIISSEGNIVCEGDETDVKRIFEELLEDVENDETTPYYPGDFIYLAKIERIIEVK